MTPQIIAKAIDLGGEVWTFLGVVVTTLGAFAVAMRNSSKLSGPQDRSASAAELAALGARLDVTNARVDAHERTIRGLRNYIAEDHAEHRAQGWPIRPLPQELA